ncbi:MAG: tetratricopeptide repeat protein [Prevotellaceae bacterium]|nr:tetratricopeptide repeat protein [Prevotellaceae bacterium]
MQNLSRLIQHPEELDKETLYDLRSLLALYPYFQTARLLMLQNLYILHDPSFDEELRRAAIYIQDRTVIFQMIEAAHYRLRQEQSPRMAKPATTVQSQPSATDQGDRTEALINHFLDSIPSEEEEPKKKKRKPTPADAAVDYVSYLLETESDDEKEAATDTPQMKGQQLIDDFLEDGGFDLTQSADLSAAPADEEETEKSVDEEPHDVNVEDNNEGVFTETLARIYIKQGRYSKALEIIRRLNLNYPKKNAYFADQIRFLEKLILNEKVKK